MLLRQPTKPLCFKCRRGTRQEVGYELAGRSTRVRCPVMPRDTDEVVECSAFEPRMAEMPGPEVMMAATVIIPLKSGKVKRLVPVEKLENFDPEVPIPARRASTWVGQQLYVEE